MASLRVEKLRKTFGHGNVAAKDLSFEVADQEFVFLLGPSGAGKTTTLRMIAGLEQPDTGSVAIGNVDVTGASPRDRNVAMVYDKNSLYPHLTVYENMAYPLRLRKMPETEMAEHIGRVSKILRIEHLLQRRPQELSGGQQQRVAIGRMLVKKADIYLMDEPISHLDAKLRAHMRLEFKKLQKEFKATILYVSHDQLEAMTMGDRVVVMNEGIIQQVGRPRDIFEKPANRFVAGFVGEPSMNIVDGRAQSQDGQLSVMFANQSLVLSAAASANVEGAIAFGFRPQHIRVTTESGVNALFGVVYAAETLGSETIVDVEVEGTLLRALVKNKDVSGVDTSIGARIGLYVDPNAIYLFDAVSGRTLCQADLSKLPHD